MDIRDYNGRWGETVSGSRPGISCTEPPVSAITILVAESHLPSSVFAKMGHCKPTIKYNVFTFTPQIMFSVKNHDVVRPVRYHSS